LLLPLRCCLFDLFFDSYADAAFALSPRFSLAPPPPFARPFRYCRRRCRHATLMLLTLLFSIHAPRRRRHYAAALPAAADIITLR
jgi:hypothetical protein